MNNLIGIILALLGFGVLIMVHETGHLIAAKKSGVKVEEFWIGMGPQILKKQIGETTYYLRLLPIGGACVMEGEDSEAISERSFGKASRPRRFIILVAGVTMNFIVGFLILLFVSPSVQNGQVVSPTLEGFYEGFKYEGENGLMAGDTFLEIDGYKINRREDIDTAITKGAVDGEFDIVVRRNGEKVEINNLAMKPEIKDGDRMIYGLKFALQDVSIPMRLVYAFWDSVDVAKSVWTSLGMLVTGQVGADQISGPVGVTAMMSKTAQFGIRPFLQLLALISINLGVMNLLPIPALDGGRILFLIVEAIRRKPLNQKLEAYVNAAGLVLLLVIMVFATGNDVLKLLR